MLLLQITKGAFQLCKMVRRSTTRKRLGSLTECWNKGYLCPDGLDGLLEQLKRRLRCTQVRPIPYYRL